MTGQVQSQARAAAALTLVMSLAACDRGPAAIRYGQDQCTECSMTLVDQHYGAELITTKGKVLKFDDLTCLLTFQRHGAQTPGTVAQIVVIDFSHSNVFLPVEQAYFLRHNNLHTPMASGLAAFSTEAELEATRGQLGGAGQILRWPDVMRTP